MCPVLIPENKGIMGQQPTFLRALVFNIFCWVLIFCWLFKSFVVSHLISCMIYSCIRTQQVFLSWRQRQGVLCRRSEASWRGKPGQGSRLGEFKQNPGTARWDPPTQMMEERALQTSGSGVHPDVAFSSSSAGSSPDILRGGLRSHSLQSFSSRVG